MRLDRLDRTVVLVVAACALVLGFLILRGDQVGVQVVRSSPTPDANNVAALGPIRLSFSEAMVTTTVQLQLNPSVTGMVVWGNSATVVFYPAQPLQNNSVYQLTVKAGATSTRGRRLIGDYTLSFRTGQPRLAYLAPASGVSDIFVRNQAGGEPQRLTSEPFGVRDFAISPDGMRIAYSAKRSNEGQIDLWLIDANGGNRQPLLTCDNDVCQAPSWSADGTRIAFERRTLIESQLGVKTPGPSRIWLLDVDSQTSQPLLEDSQRLGFSPRFAPVGDKLAFYESTRSAVMVFDIFTQDQTELPSVYGDSGAWSPDGKTLVYSELVAVDEGRFTQLLHADIAKNIITPTLPLSTVNDASAAWSPRGDVLAFSRQVDLGAQVWLARVLADGAEARALTHDEGFNFGALAWRSDGRWLAAMRIDLTVPNATPAVWLIEVATGARQPLATDAWQPVWFP